MKSDKNKGCFSWKPMYIYNICQNSSKNEMLQKKVVEKIKNTYFMVSNFFFSEYHAVYDNIWKDVVELDRQQMTKY